MECQTIWRYRQKKGGLEMGLKQRFSIVLIGIMKTLGGLAIFGLICATVSLTTHAQTVTATIATGQVPYRVAVNPVTNKIYVTNYNNNNVTVIDGATNNTTDVAAGTNPIPVAVNPNTNKVYVANVAGNNTSTVTVIDGATNNTTDAAAGGAPSAVAVNPNTNKIYVANVGSNNVTVIFDPADFTIVPNPSSATIPAGQSATFTLTVTPQGPFTSPISFSCNGLPALAGCTFNPASLTPNASTVTSTLTITTAAHTASLAPPSFGHRSM